MSKKYYYHFTNGDKLRDGRPVPAIGKWLVHKGDLVPCESGLHASEHPFDAFRYSPGTKLHLVELGGEIKTHGSPVDKVCARKRKIVKSIDATEIILKFARACALDAVKAHWPQAPAVVIEYLQTGYESKREAAAKSAAEAWAADVAAAAAAAKSAAAKSAAEAGVAWAATSAAAWAAWAADAATSAGAAETKKYRALFKRMVIAEFNKI